MNRGLRLLEPRSIFQATATNHISLRVADRARTRDFYQALFGTAGIHDDATASILTFGSPSRSLVLRQAQDDEPTPVVDHFAISVAGFDSAAVEMELKAHGFRPQRRGERAWAIADPFGFAVEVCAEEGVLPDSPAGSPPHSAPVDDRSGAFRVTAVNHIAYLVPKYAETRDFYVDMFGMQVTFEDRQKCAISYGDPEDALYISSNLRSNVGVVDHLAFSISGFDLAGVEDRLHRLGFDPEDDGPFAWSIWDPDGLKIQLCAETGVYPGGRRDPYHLPQ